MSRGYNHSKGEIMANLFRDEARRLAKLSARDRKAALDVHRRIADDARLSEATRAYARNVAETLQKLIAKFRKKYDAPID